MMATAAIASMLCMQPLEASAQGLDSILRHGADALRRMQQPQSQPQPQPQPPPQAQRYPAPPSQPAPAQRYPAQAPQPAVPRAAPDHAPESDPRAIAEAQEYLNVLGYEAGSVDGVLGAGTRRALQRFQGAASLPATGELTSSTLGMLRNAARNHTVSRPVGNPQSEQPASSAAAPGGDQGRNARTFRELGLRVVGDAVDLRPQRMSDDERRAYENFFKLIRLKVQPDLIDAPGSTIEFISFLPSQEATAFADAAARRWKGRDQFETEDSRQRFLSQHKARILGLVPSLPLAARVSRPLNTDQYSRERQGFDLAGRSGGNNQDLWSDPETASGLPGSHSPSLGGVVITPPVKLPALLRANEADAREIKEFERSSPASRLVANIRFSLTEIRRLGRYGVGVDTALDGIELSMGNHRLGPSVALPVPEFRAVAAYHSEASTEPALMNADAGRLIAVKVDAGLLESEEFVRRSLQIRIDMERHMAQFRGGTMDGSTGPFLLPATLLNGNAKPTQADLVKYKALMQERAGQAGKVLRLQNVGPVSQTISLRTLFAGWSVGRARPLSEQTEAIFRQRVPNAMGFISIAAGDDMPVVVGMHPSVHWEGTRNTYGSARLSVDFEMLSAEIVKVGAIPCLLLVLNPIAIGPYAPNGKATLAALAATATNAGYKFDILGAKLGMNLDEAVSKIESMFPEYQSASAELSGKSADPLLRVVQIDIGKDASVIERFFVGTRHGSDNVVFIKRGAIPGSDASTPESTQGMTRAIQQKYGVPTHRSNNKTTSVWVADPVFAGGIAQAHCWQATGHVYDRDTISYAHVTQRCGEILTIDQHDAKAGYLLLDSTVIVDAREEAARRAPPAPVAPSGTKSRL